MPSWSKVGSSLKTVIVWPLALGIPKNYRRDWQYVIAASRMTSALSLATLFSVIAIVTKMTDLVNLGRPTLACFVLAVLAYVLAILVIRFRAPAFLQEYPDYKSFDDKKHSHRWILWELWNNLPLFENGFALLRETVEKRLTTDVTTPLSRSQLPVARSFQRPLITGTMNGEPLGGVTPVLEFKAYEPMNFDRDLIMAFTMTSSADNIERKYVLPIREGDAKRDLKCKELFWIIFTRAAKENPRSKYLAWVLVRVSVLLIAVALLLAVIHSILGASPKPAGAAAYFQYA